MSKFLFRLVALPTLVAASCGGDGIEIPDLSSSPIDLSMPPVDQSMPPIDQSPPADLTPPPDLLGADLSDCSTIYRLASGNYPSVVGSANISSDTCNTGVINADLETTRKVQNDGAGNITISSADGSVVVGSGPVRCNKGVLVSGPFTISNGSCRFTANYKVDVTVTADNALTMALTQTRSDTVSEAGMVCNQPATCAVSYRLSIRM